MGRSRPVGAGVGDSKDPEAVMHPCPVLRRAALSGTSSVTLVTTLAVTLVTTLAGTLAGTFLAPAADAAPGARAAGRVASTPAAARALEQVVDAGDGSGPHDVTLALRDLRLHRDGLRAADRVTADRMLTRPAADQKACLASPAVCVHWMSTGSEAATSAYAQQALDVAGHVLSTYAAAGYRAPLADGSRGGDGSLDIYLRDIGRQGYYGWCDSDAAGSGGQGAPAYCVFDNDYREFPAHTPLENLEVTAAHELFHAVQFGYDYREDGWFMEATATWAEDEVYSDVDDNLQYLPTSPLRQPGHSMDVFQQSGFRQYGDWIFFRYLTERLPAEQGGLPTLVRSMWERASGVGGGSGTYSIRAVRDVLAARRAPLRTVWGDFVAANRQPGASYAEGRANRYPVARLARRGRLTAGQRASGPVRVTIDHLAGATLRWTRAAGLAARRLRVTLDLPRPGLGSSAVVTVKRAGAGPVSTPVRLASDGAAAVRVPFGPDVAWVEVSLGNAGTRYRCWRGTDWSCQGRPLDDGRVFTVGVRAQR